VTNLYERFVPTSVVAGSRSAVAKDRDRIVHSGALRRLQRKSQIIGAEASDFFRTRLTHTLECAQIGRGIARSAPASDWITVVDDVGDREDLVEAICLAHDLGHPPFGHNGEQALQAEMKQRAECLFEGNAQSFRIVTLLEPKLFGEAAGRDRWVGLNLSRTTLRGMCKYPLVETGQMKKQEHPKFGIYDDPDDREYFDWLWDGDSSVAQRTLATEILDLSDDIAYAVHDFEDGVWAGMIPLYALMTDEEAELTALTMKVIERDKRKKMRLFEKQDAVATTVDDLLRPLRNEVSHLKGLKGVGSKHWAERPFDQSRESRAYLKNFGARLIGELIDDVTPDGKFSAPSDAARRKLDVLIGMAWVWMIERSDLETKRFAQRRVVQDLFAGYWERPEMLPQQVEWRRIADKAREKDDVWREKARLICDHIAAMTDLYAHGVHQDMYQASQAFRLEM
jgi:dGTPase